MSGIVLNNFIRLKIPIRGLIIILFFGFCLFGEAQVTASSKKVITAEFLHEELEFKELAFLSNILKVKNNNGKTYTFSVSVNVPNGWKCLVDENKEYSLKPNDSMFVPVRILTNNKKAKGGTKYSISAYVNTNEGKQMAYARFLAGRPKISNWNMHILPQPRIYFLNGESSSAFQVNIANDGDENEDIILSMQKIGRNLVVKDSADKILKRNYSELQLRPYSDTTLNFKVSVLNNLRHERRVDVWNYHPNEAEISRRYSLYLRASEVRVESKSTDMRSKKVDFIKLANSIDFVKLNNFTQVGNGSNTIPLTVFMNVNNIMGQQPILFINFQGNSQIGKKAAINYFLQTGFLYYKYSNNFLTNQLSGNFTYTRGSWYAGINFAGNNFKSLYGGYSFKSGHSINLFLTRQRFFGPSNFNNLGLNYSGGIGIFRLNTVASVSTSSNSLVNYQIFSGLSFRLNRFISAGIFGGYGLSKLGNLSNQNNKSIGGNFSFNFNRYNLGIFGNYSRFDITTTGILVKRLSNYSIGLSNSYSLKRGNAIMLNNQLQVTNTSSQLTGNPNNSITLTNLFSYGIPPSKKVRPLTYSPAFYLNFHRLPYDSVNADSLLQGGLQLIYSRSVMDKQLFLGGMSRMGYSALLNMKEKGTFFNFSTNFFVRYKVYNIMFLYNYGGFGVADMAQLIKNINGNIYPQTVRINFGHQFQFKNKHFILENNPTYMYVNTLKRSALGMFSQLYYFTDNNWRISVNSSLNFTRGLLIRYNSNTANGLLPVTGEGEMTSSRSLLFGLTVKKDFSIPIPKKFRNSKMCDAKLQVFLDVNGNHRKDDGEVPVENVILRLNEFEVITDENGMGSFINTTFAKYHLQVLPLSDMGSWFPNVLDSVDVCGPDIMFIPFSKGVQVYGVVDLDREAYSGELFDKLDVSRFKIYLIDSTGRTFSSITDNRGNFNFYVPYQKYTLKFDEKALGSTFYLPENDIPLDLRSGVESYYHHFLIIEKKRRVKKKVFGPDGKITYVEENASSQSSGKNNNSGGLNNGNAQNSNKNNTGSGVKNGTGNNNAGGTSNQSSISMKEHQLDSLIDVLNKLMLRMATKADVRAIVKQELQLLMDELNATFTIKIEELPSGRAPSGLLLQLVRLNKVEQLKTKSGSTIYFSGDYSNINEAERFCRDYQTSGFRNAKVEKRKTLLGSGK